MRSIVPRRPSDAGRPGYTLFEIMIVMVFTTILMSLISVVVSRVILANSAAGEHLNDILMLGELGDQFRRDVRAAASTTLSPPDAPRKTLELAASDGSVVEYEIAGRVVRREQTTAGKPIRRETYSFNRMRVLGWQQRGSSGDEVTMTIARASEVAPGAEPAEAGQFDVVAILDGRQSATKSSE